ncbi:hypothetical protein KIW84_044951, partial [Lathyrus oleraceus]
TFFLKFSLLCQDIKMSIVYSHAQNYSQVESSLVDTTIGFFNQETFRNHNHQYYSPSTSSEMETMFTNSQHVAVKQEENEPFSSHYNGYSSYASPLNPMIYQTQQNQGLPNDFDASFSAVSSFDSENYISETNIDSSTKNCFNLIRHKSSPPEFFSNYSLHNASMNFSSTQIIESDEHEAIQPDCITSKNIRKCYMPSFTTDCWDNSTFNVPKTSTINGEIIFSTSNALQTQVHKTKVC